MDFRLLSIIVALGVALVAPASAADAAREAMQAGMAQESAGQYADAIGSFTKALDSGGLSTADRVRALYDRGVARDALGRTQEAVQDYTEALRLDAKFAPALNNRANAYRRLGKPDEAARDYWATLAIPGAAYEYTYYGLGQIAESQEDVERARRFYRMALKRNPRFALVARSLAVLDKRYPPLRPGFGDRRPPASKAPPAQPAKPPPPAKPVKPQLPAKPAEPAKNAKVKDLEAKVAAAKREVEALKAAKRARAASAKAAPGPARTVAAKQKNKAADQPKTDARRSGTAMVQLAAFRSRGEVDAAWKRIAAKQAGALKGRGPTVVEADVPGKGHYFRLRIAVDGAAEARGLCAALKAGGQDCMIAR